MTTPHGPDWGDRWQVRRPSTPRDFEAITPDQVAWEAHVRDVTRRAIQARHELLTAAAIEVGAQAVLAGLCGQPNLLVLYPPAQLTGTEIVTDVMVACRREPHPHTEDHEATYDGEIVRWRGPA